LLRLHLWIDIRIDSELLVILVLIYPFVHLGTAQE
jgi:hypothetical protein